jgi:hypothetical protein
MKLWYLVVEFHCNALTEKCLKLETRYHDLHVVAPSTQNDELENNGFEDDGLQLFPLEAKPKSARPARPNSRASGGDVSAVEPGATVRNWKHGQET